jgi:hypothetical protein
MELKMSEIVVRSGVPLPSPRGRGVRESKYPFASMAVGDSFVLADASARTVRRAVAVFQKKFKSKFAVRVIAEGVGVWRVE